MALSCSAKMCFGALMTSAVFLLQSFCFFFPATGTLFSTACTTVVAAAAVILKRYAVIVYFSAGLLILALSPRYAVEYLMTTGFVGLSLGLWMETKGVFSLLISSIGMFIGLGCMTYLFGTAALGRLFTRLPIDVCLPVYAVFALAYSILWFYISKRYIKKVLIKCRYQY